MHSLISRLPSLFVVACEKWEGLGDKVMCNNLCLHKPIEQCVQYIILWDDVSHMTLSPRLSRFLCAIMNKLGGLAVDEAILHGDHLQY